MGHSATDRAYSTAILDTRESQGVAKCTLSANKEGLLTKLAQLQFDRQALVDAYKQTRTKLKHKETLNALDA